MIENLKLGYKFKKIEISADNINEFQIMERSRMIRKSQVGALRQMMFKNDHFDSPIIVNNKNEKKRVIDGQHRITMLRDVIRKYPYFRIQVLIVEYKDLSREEEKRVFLKWNSGTRQSTDDKMMIMSDEIPIFDILKERGLVSIYKEEGKFKFRNAVEPYIRAMAHNVNQEIRFNVFIVEAKKLKEKDADEIEKFLKEFKAKLGDPIFGNKFTRMTFFSAIMYVYFAYKGKFWDKFMKVKDNNRIEELSLASGRNSIQKIVDFIIDKVYGTKREEVKMREFDKEVFWNKEKIDFLRDSFERTTYNLEEVKDMFNDEYGVEFGMHTIKSKMHENKIEKNERWNEKMADEGKLKTFAFTKKWVKKIKEMCKTMKKKDVFSKIQIDAEMPVSYSAFTDICKKKKIVFLDTMDIMAKCSKDEMKIIKKYKHLSTWEIKDKIIEENETLLEAWIIKGILKKMGIWRGKVKVRTGADDNLSGRASGEDVPEEFQ
jgi:hypothetical protein